tara:strand:+ start:432 stop:860 length:429 start_codon:yes stop_codon:yes gene_type:complete
MRLSDVQHTVDLSLEELVDELVAARATLAAQQQAVWYLDKAVIEGMQERGATVVKTAAGEATLRTPVSYDYGKLAALREITSPDDLIGYTPEREVTKTQPERWNMTQGKTLAKLSRLHADIIEDAKIHGDPQIKFKERKGDR